MPAQRRAIIIPPREAETKVAPLACVFTSADTLFPHNLGGTQLRGGTSADTLVLQDYGENKNVLVTCADSGGYIISHGGPT